MSGTDFYLWDTRDRNFIEAGPFSTEDAARNALPGYKVVPIACAHGMTAELLCLKSDLWNPKGG